MGTVVGAWRIKMLIVLFILLTGIYIVNGFFYDTNIDEAGYIINENINISDGNITDIGQNEGQNFITVTTGLGDYLTFGNIQNTYARLILTIFTTVCWLCMGYIIYSFIKEWIPFV